MSVDKNKLKDVTKETYKRKLAGLSRDVLKDIEGAVFKLYYHFQKKYDPPELGGHDIQTLSKLVRIIPQPDKHFAVYSKIEDEWQIWDSKNDLVHVQNAERILSVIEALLNGTDNVVRIIKKQNGLYLSIEGDKKNYFISDKEDTGKAILLSTLSQPSFGTLKTIESVYEKIKNETQGTIKHKENVLRGYLKEINRSLKESKAPIRFGLKVTEKSVSLVVKSGSS